MDKKTLFKQALTLRDQGKFKESADLLLSLAIATDDLFEKAGMLLNLTDTLKAAGTLDLARTQLNAARELLIFPPNTVLGNADDENRRMLLIWAELEDASIVGADEKLQKEALASLNKTLADHQSELCRPNFAEIYQAVQRDRGFLLTNLGSFAEALPILEEVDSADPHDRWTLFYLGFCYSCTGKFPDAQRKLEEAIRLGLTPDYEGRARCALGASYYELGDYARAKSELEQGVKTASPRYVKKSGIWKWLEYTCVSLGLKAEAEHYRRLARSS
jgi:tetratricopeptide (TPR) repeat protein